MASPIEAALTNAAATAAANAGTATAEAALAATPEIAENGGGTGFSPSELGSRLVAEQPQGGALANNARRFGLGTEALAWTHGKDLPPSTGPKVLLDELLSARTRELETQGVPNAQDVAALERTLGFHLNLDPAAIEARAAELKKLFTEVTLPIPQAYHDLPDHQQQALILIGRAMRYLNVPFRIQCNADGEIFEKLMETPALAPLRPFYLRWGGIFDLTRSELVIKGEEKDHIYYSFLPGMEQITRSPGGGMYPTDIKTKNDFHKYVPKDSALTKEMRVIFKYDAQGQLVAIPYSQVFAEWLVPAAKLLEEAATLLETDLREIASYLKVAANAYRTNDFTSSDESWVQLQADSIDMDLNPVEQYADKVRHSIAQFAALIQIRNTQVDAELAVLKSTFSELEELIQVPDQYNLPADQRNPPRVSAVKAIYATADSASGEIIARAYNRPNDEKVRKEKGKRIVLMENIGRIRDESTEFQILIQLAISPKYRHLVTPKGIKYFVRYHEIAHGNGVEYVVDKQDTTSREALGKIFGSLEEFKADITGLHNAKQMVKMGKLSEDLLHQMYVSYVARCIGVLRKGLAEDHVAGALGALNAFQEKGAISIDPTTGLTDFYFEKMDEAVSQLCGTFIIFKGDGDKAGADGFYAKYTSSVPTGLEHILRAMQNLPCDIMMHFAFEELLN